MSQPTNPQMKALKEGTMMAMATDMNNSKCVAAGLLPCFGFELLVEGDQIQVNVQELNTGHDIRMAREVAAGLQEAMRQLVAKIDAHLETQPKQPSNVTRIS
jgi:hypothetical protein